MIVKVDLETVDPKGRVDVLTYRGAEKLAKYCETKYGILGIWDAVKPYVHDLVTNNVTGVDIPPEVKVLLQLLQANWNVGGGNNGGS